MLLAAVCGMSMPLSAQGLLQRVDSVLTTRYRKGGVDTAYVMRPQTNWTVRTRLNVSPGCEELHGPLRPGRPGARMELPDGMVRVKTLNLNAFYTFNSRRFSCLTFSQGHPLLPLGGGGK